MSTLKHLLMKMINSFLTFIGLNSFMAFIILLLLEYQNGAMVFLTVAASSFTGILFFYIYKLYLLNTLKKNKPN